MKSKKITLFYSVGWNLVLITVGGVILSIGIKSIAIPHGFISGGFSGLSLLVYYVFGGLSPGIWYCVLNIPLFIAGWLILSRRYFFYFNLALFSLSLGFLKLDVILYSLVLAFVVSQVMDYFLSMFNQRKMVIIISDKSDSIAKSIFSKLKRGGTFLYGRGAYTGRRKKVLLTVVNNYQLKRLEEAVFGIDSEAFFITESTFNVIGRGFSRRRVY